MTEGPLPGQAAPTARGGRGPAPEIVGGALAVIVLAVIGTSVLAGGGRPAVSEPPPSLVASSAPLVPTVAPIVDPAVVSLLGALNAELVTGADSLQRELDRASLRTADVNALIRQLNQKVGYGSDVVRQLGGALGVDEPGGKLAAVYDDIAASATDTLGASINNAAAYRIGAGALIKLIDRIPPLQQALEDLLAAPPSIAPSASPPVATPSPPPPSATPSPAPATATPVPSTAKPSGSASVEPTPAGDEQIVNGGFESPLGPPWQLLVGGGADATMTTDTVNPGSGKTSARIDIVASSTAYGGISLQQAGIDLEAGRLYTLALTTRGATDRDLRIQISSTSDQAYLTRLVTVGAAWAPSTFTFTAPVTDPNAVLQIELGRSTVTTWIDAVSFRPEVAGP